MTGGRLMSREQIIELITVDLAHTEKASVVISKPPIGCYRVLNIYVDQDGKLKAEWEDTPQGG
jgi:hypothetical protein